MSVVLSSPALVSRRCNQQKSTPATTDPREPPHCSVQVKIEYRNPRAASPHRFDYRSHRIDSRD